MHAIYGNARTRFVIPVILGSALAPYFVSAAIVAQWIKADESTIEALALMIASYAAIGLALWGLWLCKKRGSIEFQG